MQCTRRWPASSRAVSLTGAVPLASAQACCQPGARKFPIALNCDFRNTQLLGNLALRETGKETQFGDTSGARRGALKLRECLVNGPQIVVRATESGVCCIERYPDLAAASAFRVVGSRMIDQNPAQGTRRHGEKMRAAPPLRRGTRFQAKVQLVN